MKKIPEVAAVAAMVGVVVWTQYLGEDQPGAGELVPQTTETTQQSVEETSGEHVESSPIGTVPFSSIDDRLHIVATNAVSGRPLEGVDVFVGKNLIGRTDSAGEVLIPPGRQLMVLMKDEYLPVAKQITAEAKGKIRVPLNPGITVSGRVVDQDGFGLKDANVEISFGSPGSTEPAVRQLVNGWDLICLDEPSLQRVVLRRVAVTDAKGDFCFQGMPRRVARIEVMKPGYVAWPETGVRCWLIGPSNSTDLVDLKLMMRRVYIAIIRLSGSSLSDANEPGLIGATHTLSTSGSKGLEGLPMWYKMTGKALAKSILNRLESRFECFFLLRAAREGSGLGEGCADGVGSVYCIGGGGGSMIRRFYPIDAPDVPATQVSCSCTRSSFGTVVVESNVPVMLRSNGIFGSFDLPIRPLGSASGKYKFVVRPGSYPIREGGSLSPLLAGGLAGGSTNVEVLAGETARVTYSPRSPERGKMTWSVSDAVGRPTDAYVIHIQGAHGSVRFEGSALGASATIPCAFGKYGVRLADISATMVFTTAHVEVAQGKPGTLSLVVQ